MQKVLKFSKSLGGDKTKTKKKSDNKEEKFLVIPSSGRGNDIVEREIPLNAITEVVEELSKDTDNKIIIQPTEENPNVINEKKDDDNDEESSQKRKELAEFFKQKK